MTTVLLDANNLAMRAFHAAKYSMTTGDGIETGSLHILMGSLSKMLHALQPTRFVACWDGGASSYRMSIYPGYKGARHPEGAPGHASTFALIQEFLDLVGIAQWRQAGVEADDLIAQAVINERKSYLDPIVILSSDKDLLQCLIDYGVSQWRFTSAGPDVWDRERVWADLGYTVEEIPRIMSLTGDASDSIPGVRGIGPKKALALLRKTPDPEDRDEDPWGPFEHFTPEQYAAMELSYKLVKLPAPGIEVDPVPRYRPLSFSSPEIDWQAMANFCTRYELRKLWTELEAGVLLAQGSP